MVFYFYQKALHCVFKYKCTGFIRNLSFETTSSEVLQVNCKKVEGFLLSLFVVVVFGGFVVGFFVVLVLFAVCLFLISPVLNCLL